MAPLDRFRKLTSKIISKRSGPAEKTVDSVIKEIEVQTGRAVTIKTEPSVANLASSHPQLQSLLFQLPVELRDLVWHFVIQACDDPDQTPDPQNRNYRAGYVTNRKQSLGLQQTCRRAWLETNSLPLKQIEHCFWLKRETQTPPRCQPLFIREELRLQSFLARLTYNGRQNLNHLRFFIQDEWLTRQLWGLARAVGFLYGNDICSTRAVFVPRVFTLTISDEDWSWGFPTIHPKGLLFLVKSLSVIGVQEFRLELEMQMSENHILEEAVKSVRGYEFPQEVDDLETGHWRPLPRYTRAIQLESILRLQEEQGDCVWVGRNKRPGTSISHLPQSEGTTTSEVQYRVITLIWRRADYGGAESGGSVISNHSQQQQHQQTQDIPDYQTTSGSHMRTEEGLAAEYIRRWKKEGSLLYFAPLDRDS